MGIRNRNMQRNSCLWTMGSSFFTFPVPTGKLEGGSSSTAHEAYINDHSLAGLTVGDDIGIDVVWPYYPFNLRFSREVSGGTTGFALDILGEDQFGIQRTETVDMTSSTNVYTVWCYRKLISATVHSIAGTDPIPASNNIDVGMLWGGAIRIPMWGQNIPTDAVEAIVCHWIDPGGTQAGLVASGSITVDADKNNIKINAPIPASPTVDSTTAEDNHFGTVYLDPNLMGPF